MMFSVGFYGIFLIWCIGQSMGQGLQFPDTFNGAVGESVVFALDSPAPTGFSEVEWLLEDQIILISTNGVIEISPNYTGRVSLDPITLALTLMNLTTTDSGKYVLTVRIQTQRPRGETSLAVYEKVSNTRVIGPVESLIEGNTTANITCDGNGNITSVKWMKNNTLLNPSDSVIFSADNRSVSISPVFRSDRGEYECTLANPVSSDTAKLSLIINYGPDYALVKGPNEVALGHEVSLTCSTDSVPLPSFTWKFNGTDTNVTTETFKIEKSDFPDSGDYICTALNDVTNLINDSQRHTLIVKEVGGGGGGGDGSDGGNGGVGLTTGAIVGIVIGVLVAVVGICGLIFYLTKTKKIQKATMGKNKPANKALHRAQDHELNYAEISHEVKSSEPESQIPRNINESRTEYAQIMHGASANPQAPLPPNESQAQQPSNLPEGVTYAQVMKRT